MTGPKITVETLRNGQQIHAFHRYCQDSIGNFFMVTHKAMGSLHPSIGKEAVVNIEFAYGYAMYWKHLCGLIVSIKRFEVAVDILHGIDVLHEIDVLHGIAGSF
jgi:hypothetical protein